MKTNLWIIIPYASILALFMLLFCFLFLGKASEIYPERFVMLIGLCCGCFLIIAYDIKTVSARCDILSRYFTSQILPNDTVAELKKNTYDIITIKNDLAAISSSINPPGNDDTKRVEILQQFYREALKLSSTVSTTIDSVNKTESRLETAPDPDTVMKLYEGFANITTSPKNKSKSIHGEEV